MVLSYILLDLRETLFLPPSLSFDARARDWRAYHPACHGRARTRSTGVLRYPPHLAHRADEVPRTVTTDDVSSDRSDRSDENPDVNGVDAEFIRGILAPKAFDVKRWRAQ